MRTFVALVAGSGTWLAMYLLAALIWYNFVNIFWLSYNWTFIGGMLVGTLVGLGGFAVGLAVFLILHK